MRRSLGNLRYPVIGRPTTPSLLSSAFSSASDGGSRGRGRGHTHTFQFTADQPVDNNSKPESPSESGSGHGRGRGKPLPSSSPFPSFAAAPPGIGRGRGVGFAPPDYAAAASPNPTPKKPMLFTRDDDSAKSDPPPPKPNLPVDIISVFSGAGRGKQAHPPAGPTGKPKPVENRHLRPRQPPKPVASATPIGGAAPEREREASKVSPKETLSTEEKVRKAMSILSQGGGGAEASGSGGRGRGGFRGGRGGRVGGQGGRRDDQESDGEPQGLYIGDPAAEEKLAARLGPENMNKLAEAFEEAADRALPTLMDDALVDALHTNLLIECEEEYLMEQFGSNPDIDEKPPISLREALEKMKPFLMAYEGIQSQEEWEEAIEETMQRVPLLKEIVDHYSGPDRITAKQQQQELERVARTLPERTPASVKRFTEQALLSLQSNPGWGFDKKCQFMDKLVADVSQQYK